ncbi:hypothetical protein SCHPADRAFT_938612 [Schizopora paradoxa]|uniref:F-box domain-containing protein n=1 Tax=Schizopora paradoxa TaxID=27342 RepID=A0A0H2RVJ7_9AGAM|nr:hypothetical protein SCHPADRAFT_938612 [Schizopora paradoxa]
MNLIVSKKELWVPTELIDRIFKFIERDLGSYDYKGQWDLLALLFVCKEWHDIAQRRLYSSVGIEGSQPLSLGGKNNVHGDNNAFFDLVKAKPHLASLVRELRIGAFYQSIEEAATHARLVPLCTNIQRVVLAGNDRQFLAPLKSTLAQMDLIEFTLSHLGRRDKQSEETRSPADSELCTPSEIISYMLNWPRLRKFVAQTSTRTYELGEEEALLPSVSAVEGRCPDLREISLGDCTFSAKQLLLLSALTPNVRRANLSIQADATDALFTCLERWSSTLEHLSISSPNIESDSASTINIDPYPDLYELRSLTTSSQIIPPDMLATFIELESLEYTATTEHIEHLCDILHHIPSLPLLRKLQLRPLTDFLVNMAEIPRTRAAVIALRGICNTRKIRFSDITYLFRD